MRRAPRTDCPTSWASRYGSTTPTEDPAPSTVSDILLSSTGWSVPGRFVLVPRLGVCLRFDAVLHPLAGAPTYEWARRLREPSYALSRREPGDG